MSGYSTVGSQMADEPIMERVLMVKQEAFIYKIPSGTTCFKLFFS
jgi:hypothetical protein